MKYYFLLLGIVLLFFNQIIFGKIPFPGDLLINENPYKTESFQGYNPGSYPNKAQGQDVITEIYPWRHFAIGQLKSGHLPLWNPHNFSGNQQLANFQTAVFYPLNIFYFILPFNAAWTLLIILSPLLAAVFMFIFLTKSLKLSDFAGFLGGVAFAFSSYMTVWLEWGNIGHTILWLPLVLYFTKKIAEKITTSNFAALILTLTLSILAGYIQGVFYIYLISFLYFFYSLKPSKDRSKKIILFLVVLTFPFLLSAFQILSTGYLFLNSTRGGYSLFQISELLLPIKYWVTGLASDFFGNPATRNYWIQGTYIERVMYVGIPILLFAFISLKSKIKVTRFFLFSAIFSLLAATNLPLVKFLYLIPIPVISTTVPTRELSLFIFSLVVLGAVGIDYWQNNEIKTKIPLFFLATYALLFISVIVLWKINILSYQNFSITFRNLFLPLFFAVSTIIIFYFFRTKNVGKIFLTFVLVFDLLYFFNKITPFSSPEFIYPKTPVISYLQQNAGINRFWGYGSAYIKSNFQTYDMTYSPEGNDPLHIESYGALLASSGNGKIPDVLPRPDANIAPGYGSSDLANNFYRQRILNLLGVKYVLNQTYSKNYDNTFPPEKYDLIWQNTPWQIYVNKEALPRFFLANDYNVYNSKSEVLKDIYNKNIDLGKILLLESVPDIKIDKTSENSIKLLSYTPNKIIFSTKSSGNSLLFLSDNYFFQWETLIDGKQARTLIADYAFRAAAIPKGNHTVEFSYNSFYFSTGLKISIICFILLLIVIFSIKKHEKN